MKAPVLTIVTPTYNAQDYLERYFASLESQTLHQDAYEILIIDGGSTDETKQIAKSHGATIIHNPKKLAEPGVALGFEKAKSELVMVLAVDNIFCDAHALEQMIQVFKNSHIAAAFPKHEAAPDDSLYSRYFNIFTDPYTHFVYGYAANARTFFLLYKTIQHTDTYIIYDYLSAYSFPLIALAQGFTVRKNMVATRSDGGFDDVLTVYSLIKQKKQIAYMHTVSLYHYTVSDFADFLKKQRRAVENALVRGNSGISQRNTYLTAWQKMKRYLFFPYAFSIILPFSISLVQAIRFSELTWLLHTYMVFVSAWIILTHALGVFVKRSVRK